MDEEKFGSYLDDIVGSGFLTLAISIGRSTGLFKTMCAMDNPATVAEIADRAKLKERYVKEWLGSMVAAKIIHIAPDSDRYHIPKSHRAALLGPTAVMADCLIVMARRHDILLSCFQLDGPRGYNPYTSPDDSLVKWQDDYQKETVDSVLDDMISQLGDFKKKLEEGINVADIGCGSGLYDVEMAKRFPKSTFVGLDSAQEAIEGCKALAAQVGVPNVAFELTDVCQMNDSWTDRFDWIFSYDVTHDLPDPVTALQQIRRVLKPGGLFSTMDPNVHSDHHDNEQSLAVSFMSTASLYVCMPCSLSTPPYAGHGACWGVEAIEQFLKDNGATVIGKHPMTNENCHFMCKFE